MKTIKFYIGLISTIFAVTSCQVKLDNFNPNQDSEKLGIESLVSDSLGFHYIRLTTSVNVLSTQPNPGVKDATVIVNDNQGMTDTFKLADNTGLYLPSKLWRGISGNTYSLSISTPKYNVTASEQMADYQNFKIDSLKSVFREKATEARVNSFSYNDIFFTGKQYIKVQDSVFRVRLFALNQLPYRINVQVYVFRGDNIFSSNSGFFVNNLSEVPINNFYILPPPGGGPPTNLNFISGDTVTVLLQGISEKCFVYYRGLNAVLNNDGGLFSSPAGNPPNNLSSNDAVGFFKVARITKKSIIIKFNGEIDD